MIIAILGEKGGTGKTMVATNLVGMRAAAGSKILLIDADRQGSAQRWAKIREDEGLAQVTVSRSPAMPFAATFRHASRATTMSW